MNGLIRHISSTWANPTRRLAAFGAAVLVELVLLLVLLGLTPHFGPKPDRKSLTVLTITPEPIAQPKEEPAVPQPKRAVTKPSQSQPLTSVP